MLCVPGVPEISDVPGTPMGIGVPSILVITAVPGIPTSTLFQSRDGRDESGASRQLPHPRPPGSQPGRGRPVTPFPVRQGREYNCFGNWNVSGLYNILRECTKNVNLLKPIEWMLLVVHKSGPQGQGQILAIITFRN